MRAEPGLIDGSIVFEPTPRGDEQGDVTLTLDAEIAMMAGLNACSLVQESQCRLALGGVRGLYVRCDGGEDLLVRCSFGAIVDVALDLRPTSPTYRLWMTMVLDDVDHRAVWLPPGLAHGYQALTTVADVCCRTNRVHRAEYVTVIRYDDPDLAIPWPLPVTDILERDRTAPSLAVLEPMLSDWFRAV
jgi:dTDP-4-dehydrorhamnose 3,5-epimerase